MADQRIQSTENMVGAGHATLSDTLNRLALVEHNTDGTHGTVTGATINLSSNTLSGTTAQFNTALSDGNFATQAGTETLTNKTVVATSIQETKAVVSASNIDMATGNLFTKTISGATTFTVSNVPTTGLVGYFILELTNPGTNVTWWSGIDWPGGSAPSLTASGVDVLGFYTYDGGTNWTGLVMAKDKK